MTMLKRNAVAAEAPPPETTPAIDPVEHGWGYYRAGDVTLDKLTANERYFVTVASITFALLIFTQKIAPVLNIELGTYFVLPFSIWALASGNATVSPVRLLGYLALGVIAIILTFASHAYGTFSITALMYLVVLHLPFTIVANVRRIVYLKLLKNFQICAIIIASMVFFQWAQQAVGMKMASMEDYVPHAILFDSYNYIQKIDYFSRWYKPNAFFMLETSHTSQLLAIALVVELCILRRLQIVLYLAVGLVMSFGGTGTIMVILTAPFILRYLSSRTLMAGAVAAPIALLIGAKLGFIDNAVGRSQEFSHSGTSGSGRFIAPFQIMRDQLVGMHETVFWGIGPGNMSPYQLQHTDMMNPLSKLVVEYGVPFAILWLVWFHSCVFASRVPFVIAFVTLIQFDLTGGGLLVPIQTYYCLFLCAMFIPAQPTKVTAATPRRFLPARPRRYAAAG
jgi:hypothetical protein